MKYRLAPFCRWYHDKDTLVLETPDYRIELKPEAEDLLIRLRQGWVEEMPFVKALAQYRAAIHYEGRELRTLRRLDRYFEDQSVTVRSVRKGSTVPEATLPRQCYAFKIEPRIEGHAQARGRNIAMLKAAVEVYERLSCDALKNVELMLPDKSAVKALEPQLFVKYRDWQVQSLDFPYSEEPSGRWATVREISSGAKYRVPLELVCFPDGISGPRMTAASSNGVASHTSFEAAVLSSALELIERDALMVHWFWKAPREQITPPPALKKRLVWLKNLGFDCIFLNLTLELTPVVLAILHRQAEKHPRLVLGMASHPSPAVAIDKALQEVEYNVTFYDTDTPRVERPEDVRRIIDHKSWYDQPENHHEVMSLVGVAKVGIDGIPDGPQTIEALDESLRRQGFGWYIAELNAAGQKATGIYTVRSLIQGLLPIGFGHIMEPLGLERFIRPPTSMGGGRSDPSRQTREGYKVQPFA